jgi:hypothetical protein
MSRPTEPTTWTPTTAKTPATIARLSGLGTPIVAENSAALHRPRQSQIERKKAGASAKSSKLTIKVALRGCVEQTQWDYSHAH